MSTSYPEFIWAINSTRSDSYIRNQLSLEIGATEARKLLVKRYPSGTTAEEIELRRKAQGLAHSNSMSVRGDEGFEEEDIPESLLDQIVHDCVKFHNTYMLNDGIAA